MTTIIPIDKPYYMEVTVLDNNGDFESGLTITYQIQKSSDDSIIASGTLVEQSGGAYVNVVTFTEENQYRILYFSPTDIDNGAETVLTETADFTDIKTLLDTILEKLIKTLGLSQSNYRLTDQVYNGDGCLTSEVIKIYPTATDLENNTNLIQSYQLTAVWDGNGRISDYKVVEI